MSIRIVTADERLVEAGGKTWTHVSDAASPGDITRAERGFVILD